MPKSLSKVIYKPDSQSTDEYHVIVNPEEYKKWKEGGKHITIPLVEVVDSFHIFFTNQGSQGKLGQASHQQLEDTFGSSKDVDAVKALLEKGTLQAVRDFACTPVIAMLKQSQASAIEGGRGSSALNDAHGTKTIDTRGNPRSSGI
ncbi:DUF1960-domain-containing protein [Punctularia strigosozonata HHB-11173 SS5]|uniref:DUF1960-domain-containing protein n=1 Tax=Punctularia strigosozonata (strain HHB-11173) TaxID=741275 RepID=UPI0004418467|nr:DUF1960-domain-containing protein [Punctularia strigosozonata HHB-11173 SS5]EIN10510.1 DUF1960-domain-containing protein [Punctularia strigosozonata HHB-11173 SS5]